MPSDPNDPALTLASLAARLDRQAAAIRSLRKEVAALKAGASTSTTPPATTPPATTPPATGSPSVQPGVFVPVADCYMCGKAKENGRTALTCRACGSKRNALIKDRSADRSALLSATCGNCGNDKPRTTKMLCTPCSKAFSAWVDSTAR